MAVQPIRPFADPVLRTVAEPVTSFDRELRGLVKSLQATMRAGAGRAGLAAPQLGVSLRVLVYELDGRAGHLINPRLEPSERKIVADEACLSAPGLWWPLERSYMVTARGRDMFGKPVTVRALGMLARVLQHEADHLDGVLFIDRLPEDERERFLQTASS
ncbi:peptide deformylase [Streptosporangium roseum]|uniref:Peptide deformylase n=1 Tax=Streptosporangium roseum (strain ATCC 12428 / DSM 43021 / JCM 3005 / KCTC 9067 / NCIMB 10171 / NRRL 2505 / NI 9100) TaxID=479432 RepID=D2AU08_STRRD|nr:peptide deformylase [Streptosporangium roseum]ACZ88663.1 Peptide deformylase [Streptosporangium roseum DSM 43021]